MRLVSFFLFFLLLSCTDNKEDFANKGNNDSEEEEGVLYEKEFTTPYFITKPQDSFVIENFYSLAKRKIEYVCSFSQNTKVQFQTTIRGINCIADVENKTIEIDGKSFVVDNLKPGCDIIISFEKLYQNQIIRVDTGGQINEILLNNDGKGGEGKGAVNICTASFPMPHGYYKMELLSGNGVYLKKVRITTPSKKIYLIIYGDSITETEMYYPNQLFSLSWPQLLIQQIPETITSAMSGGRVDDIFMRMKSELPYLDVKYCMITIGTNGGNSVEKLSSLIEYVLSLGITPILNHIPCNESNTQVEANRIIDEVRNSYSLFGADFDLPTSINGDGIEIDKSTMFWEDYGPEYKKYGHDYWHHPNVKGSNKMYERIEKDIPWLLNK